MGQVCPLQTGSLASSSARGAPAQHPWVSRGECQESRPGREVPEHVFILDCRPQGSKSTEAKSPPVKGKPTVRQHLWQAQRRRHIPASGLPLGHEDQVTVLLQEPHWQFFRLLSVSLSREGEAGRPVPLWFRDLTPLSILRLEQLCPVARRELRILLWLGLGGRVRAPALLGAHPPPLNPPAAT